MVNPKETPLFGVGKQLYRTFLAGFMSPREWLAMTKNWERQMDLQYPGWGGWRFGDFEEEPTVNASPETQPI